MQTVNGIPAKLAIDQGMEAPERGEGCPEAIGLHGKAAAEALQSGAERVRRELQAKFCVSYDPHLLSHNVLSQANLQAMIRKAIAEGRPMEEWTA